MFFSSGNLITIFIVLLILVIYRQLDRSNRSLEKVKRFADKITENLNKLVEEKTTEVKDLSIDLQVNLKTGREILKRVREVETGMAHKAQDVTGIQTRLKDYDRVLGELVTMTAKVDENLKRIKEESLFVDSVGKKIHEASGQLEKLEREVPQLREDLIQENRQSLQAACEEVSRGAEERLQGILQVLGASEAKVKDFSTYISRLEGRREELEKQTLTAIQKAYEELELEAKGKRSVFLNQFLASLNKLLAEADLKGKSFQKKLDEAVAGAEQRLAETRSFSKDLGVHLGKLNEEVGKFKAEALKRLELVSEDLQVSVFQTIDQKLDAYSGEAEYRFKKLEEAGGEIGALEVNLRQLMEKMSHKVSEDFKVFAQSLEAKYQVQIQKADQGFGALKAEMTSLEAGLVELKSRAYQTVSEQLQVFEDDFFADLKNRNLAMEEGMREWQSGMEAKLQEIGAAQSAERELVEAGYSEQLKAQLEKLKHSSLEELKRIESRVLDFEGGVNERIESSLHTINSFGETMKQEVERVHQDLLKLHHKDFEAAKTDAGLWQARFVQQIKEVETEFSAKITGLRLDTDALVGSLKEDFTSQRDDLVSSSGEERAALKNELKAISDRVAGLEKELAKRAESAFESFQKQIEDFQLDFKQKSKEMQVDQDGRVQDLSQMFEELRERAESMQQTLFGKIDESCKQMNAGLSEMDKRIKGFAVQTRLFERADSLKLSLEGRIEEMKREMDKLQVQYKEVQEIESQIAGAKKTAEEVTAKLSKIVSERRRIEDMDADFKKLLTMSKDMDLRLETVYSSQDALQEIQAKIRELENLEKLTESRFERLEKKKAIIEATATGVDKNFQTLESIEKNLGGIDGELSRIAVKLEDLKNEFQLLAANKEKADSIVAKLSDLDGILTGLETRMKSLETAREWLARTETRFEAVGKQAQEQVRLLESILKAEGKHSKSETGAPALDKRETVIKLAHLGWSAQEIARTTKLSRGEVELILELAPKK